MSKKYSLIAVIGILGTLAFSPVPAALAEETTAAPATQSQEAAVANAEPEAQPETLREAREERKKDRREERQERRKGILETIFGGGDKDSDNK